MASGVRGLNASEHKEVVGLVQNQPVHPIQRKAILWTRYLVWVMNSPTSSMKSPMPIPLNNALAWISQRLASARGRKTATKKLSGTPGCLFARRHGYIMEARPPVENRRKNLLQGTCR
jgi:hypothetical protein